MEQTELRDREARCIQEEAPACVSSCPLHVDARTLLAKLASGDFASASALFQKRAPFPILLSRFCDEPCRTECKRQDAGGSVRIRSLERAALDFRGKEPETSMQRRQPESGKRVAVIGAGPCGLSAALELRKKGHAVTLFEARDRIGGSLGELVSGHPEAEAMELELGRAFAAGAELRSGTRIGSADGEVPLPHGFDAVCLAMGEPQTPAGPAPEPRDDGKRPGPEADLDGPTSADRPPADGSGASLSADPVTFAVDPGLLRADLAAAFAAFLRPSAGASADGSTGEEGRLGPHAPARDAGASGLFACGGLIRGIRERSLVGAIADGRRAAISIDRFLQGVSLEAGRELEGPYGTRLYTNLKDVEPAAAAEPSGSDGIYTREEAIVEAARCIQCECLECVKACEYLRRYGSYPKRYVREIYNNLSIVMGMRKANEFINSCTLCGLCSIVCPNGLSMAEINLQARRIMAEKGKMPPSAFDFAIRDLAFSTGDEFFLARNEPGRDRCDFLFFPGCQLSASLPDHVERAYQDLRSHLDGGVALMLGCCGAPAEWAGQEELAVAVAAAVEKEWQRLGRPIIVAGCPTCRRTLARRIPDADVENLVEVLERLDIGAPGPTSGDAGGGELCVHDACTARHDPELHESVRRTVRSLGYRVVELPSSRELAECCGYGGLAYNANRALAEDQARQRANQDRRDYVAYCAMCRDRFSAQGKNARHMLELIYGNASGADGSPLRPDFSERRENRRRLRAKLLRTVWREETDVKERDTRIVVPEDVRASMEARFILREDVEAVIAHAEATGERLKDEETGFFIASHRPGHVTYWVWYESYDGIFKLRRVYSHRMGILEARS